MTAVRVVQWTTGIVGASALRAILDDSRLELVGVFAHGAAKVGQDAGPLAGRPATGVIATDDVDALIALKPDCVVYMPHWPEVDVLERMSFRPDDFNNFDIGTTTAMPAINAVTAVVAAPSGVRSIAELPIVTARGVRPSS
jgi:hypothetical protein